MDVLVTLSMHQPHVTRVGSCWVALVEDAVLSFDTFPIGERFTTHPSIRSARVPTPKLRGVTPLRILRGMLPFGVVPRLPDQIVVQAGERLSRDTRFVVVGPSGDDG
jgi:hypothetical protein